jgi:hypothetical protein
LQLVVENEFLVQRKSFYADVKYLIAIQDDTDEVTQDPIIFKVDALKKSLKKKINKVSDQINEVTSSVSLLYKSVQASNKKLGEIASSIQIQ